MNGTREELSAALQSWDREHHDEYMRKFGLLIGSSQKRVWNNYIGRWLMEKVTTRIAAWAILKYGMLGIEIPQSGKLADIVFQWQKLARFFRAPVIVESADDERIVLVHPECTMGFGVKHAKLCKASMTMDKRILEKMGAKMTMLETIPTGAPACRHVIELIRPPR